MSATRPDHSSTLPGLCQAETLAQSVVLLLVLTVAQRFVGFVRGVLFCRYLDPQSLGEWDLAFGFLLLAAPVMVLGLPGSFGRYLEYYRQRGQLRTFLRRTSLVSACLGATGVGLVALFPARISQLVFGRADRVQLVLLLAATLASVIAYNFCVSLVTALRMFRLTTMLQFVNSLVFATVAIGLFAAGFVSTSSVIAAYCLSSLVALAVPVVLWRRGAWDGPALEQPLPQWRFWMRLAPFALWMWCSNWLTNVFELVDRYMIIHTSGMTPDVALAAVGQYHSARVVPWVLYSVATMIATVATPHLAHDWEAGRQRAVAERLNLMLKLQGFGLTLASALVLCGAPLLFNVLLGGKYAGGQEVLPETLMFCLWAGFGEIAINYLWCRERAGLGGLALFVGLLVNIVLNLVWLPMFGLWGAVAATAVGKLTAMLLIYGFAQLLGMRFDRGVWLTSALPAALCGGPVVAASALAVALLLALASDRWLLPDEKRALAEHAQQGWTRLHGWLGRVARIPART